MHCRPEKEVLCSMWLRGIKGMFRHVCGNFLGAIKYIWLVGVCCLVHHPIAIDRYLCMFMDTSNRTLYTYYGYMVDVKSTICYSSKDDEYGSNMALALSPLKGWGTISLSMFSLHIALSNIHFWVAFMGFQGWFGRNTPLKTSTRSKTTMFPENDGWITIFVLK